MAYEKRDNSGTLGRNDKKTQDKHPDHRGSAIVDGVEYWLSAWIKTGPNNSKFFSLAFTPKDESARRSNTPAPARTVDDLPDEIPF